MHTSPAAASTPDAPPAAPLTTALNALAASLLPARQDPRAAAPAGGAAPGSPASSLSGSSEHDSAGRPASDIWLYDSLSEAAPEVTLRQTIAMLGRMREDPLIAQIRRQRRASAACGCLGGWLGVVGTALCLAQGTPDSAGFAALAAGVGCTVGGIAVGIGRTARALGQDSPQRAARRRSQLLLLRGISDQLPLYGEGPAGRQRAFQAVIEVTHRLCDTIAQDSGELSGELAQAALRGCLLALVAGFAAACLTPLTGVTVGIAVALVAGALPLAVALARALNCGGSWQQLRALANRPYSYRRRVPYGVNPDMVLRVQLPCGELERLFGPRQDGDASASSPAPPGSSRASLQSGAESLDVERAGL